MIRHLRLYLARGLFGIANIICKAELNEIMSAVAMEVASKASIHATRAAFIREGVAVCRHELCTQRFGLRRSAHGYECQMHALTQDALKKNAIASKI